MFAVNDPIVASVRSSPPVNSSYSFTYNKFRQIFDRLEPVGDHPTSTNCEIIDSAFPGLKATMTAECANDHFSRMLNNYKERRFNIMFTDASLSDSRTGCGIYNYNCDTETSFHLPFKSSTAFGELLAIEEAINIASNNNYRKLVIFTDSRVSCQTLKNPNSLNSIASRILRKVHLAAFDSIHIVWIPSHKGIPGNERVDSIAKKAIDNSSCKDYLYTTDEAIKQIKEALYNEWYAGFCVVKLMDTSIRPSTAGGTRRFVTKI
ncbi:uncharacterized protein LOC118736388 [Rhagoletis pomonella]|uniref:uncharacterized protein LOC118736388 n=1 Tax=Rhagoletis pomonella TaxID=28610 RepID=UPI00177F8432|nr:uncharacterized protein LOC118736388 [Rhagoletis pomonella]